MTNEPGTKRPSLPTTDFDRFVLDPPFLGNRYEWKDFFDVADRCLRLVLDAPNVRSAVLESWVVLDYCLRDFLATAVALKAYNRPDFDVRYELLPRSFAECLAGVQRILRVHREHRPPATTSTLTISVPFLRFLRERDAAVFEKICDAEEEYARIHNFPRFPSIDTKPEAYVSDQWISMAGSVLSEDWVKRAQLLNTVRNIAAHTFDESRIASKLGINGPDQLIQVKQWCERTIEMLVGLVRKTKRA